MKANGDHLERLRTVGGHVDDRTRPSWPTTHRRLANPAPLGLLSFAIGIYLFLFFLPAQLFTIAGIFFISCYGVKARDSVVQIFLVRVLVFFGGIRQFISGIIEMISGDAFGATVFPCYGAFNLAHVML